MKIIDLLAPRFSRRRLALSILRDFFYRPTSIFGRLATENFHNYKVCHRLTVLCNVCGEKTSLSYDFPDVRIRHLHHIGVLRETLRCKKCGATMRDRQLAHGLLGYIQDKTKSTIPSLQHYRNASIVKIRILDTDSFSPINRVLRGEVGYSHSQYIHGRKNGEVLADGSIVVNLENMPFDAEVYDVILTSDVMEHVLDDVSAHREIHRCLAEGGAYLFTVPFDPCYSSNKKLTSPDFSGDHFIVDGQIHGDPHSSSGIIAHRIYGWQLISDLNGIGYTAIFEEVNASENGIFGGDLFVARKLMMPQK